MALGRLLAAVLVAGLIAAPTSDAKWFGANLKRPANATASCQSWVPFQQVPSCSWTTSGALYNPAEGMVVPGTGTITRVKVKVGAQSGPMRIAILESLRGENSGEAACCVGRRQTKRFTPKRNSTRTLTTNIPVRVKFNEKSRIYSFDSIFITMENPNTPIPANYTGQDGDNCSGGWYPAVRPGQENFGGPYGVCGYTILIRAKWRPAG
jgi:hypothetical protein